MVEVIYVHDNAMPAMKSLFFLNKCIQFYAYEVTEKIEMKEIIASLELKS